MIDKIYHLDMLRELTVDELESVSGSLVEAFDWVAAHLAKVVVCKVQ